MKQATKNTRSSTKQSKTSVVHRLLGLAPMEPAARRRSKKATPKRASVKAAKPPRPDETAGATSDNQKQALRFLDESERSRGPRVSQRLRKSPTQRIQAHAGAATKRQQRKHEIKNALPPEEL